MTCFFVYQDRVFFKEAPYKGFLHLALTAIQAEVVARETIDEWVKFTVNIIAVYKRGGDSVRRGEQVIWVEMKDLMCKCPKVNMKPNPESYPVEKPHECTVYPTVFHWCSTCERVLGKCHISIYISRDVVLNYRTRLYYFCLDVVSSWMSVDHYFRIL